MLEMSTIPNKPCYKNYNLCWLYMEPQNKQVGGCANILFELHNSMEAQDGLQM